MKKLMTICFGLAFAFGGSASFADAGGQWIEHDSQLAGASCDAEGCPSSDRADAGLLQPDSVLETQMANNRSCSTFCRGVREDDYDACIADCQSNTQADADTTLPTMIAQPTGNGGFFGNPKASAPDSVLETQLATSQCSIYCRGAREDDYDACISDCQSNAQASSGTIKTMIAGSIRVGDPQPICGTDAWACFNGTDDESPLIRDVGIFGVFAYDDGQQADPWGSGSEGSGM